MRGQIVLSVFDLYLLKIVAFHFSLKYWLILRPLGLYISLDKKKSSKVLYKCIIYVYIERLVQRTKVGNVLFLQSNYRCLLRRIVDADYCPSGSDTTAAYTQQHEAVPFGERESRLHGYQRNRGATTAAAHDPRTCLGQQRHDRIDRTFEQEARLRPRNAAGDRGLFVPKAEHGVQHGRQSAVQGRTAGAEFRSEQPYQTAGRGQRSARRHRRHRPVHFVHFHDRPSAVHPRPAAAGGGCENVSFFLMCR